MHCSFCGKRANEVERLIAGPKVYICDGCVDACIEILSSDVLWRERQISNLRRLSQQGEPEEHELDPHLMPSVEGVLTFGF
jgi:ATP-dependent Clp protease ATP-binding subunit ClpX